MKNVFIASAGARTGDSGGTFCSPAGNGRFSCEVWNPKPVVTATATRIAMARNLASNIDSRYTKPRVSCSRVHEMWGHRCMTEAAAHDDAQMAGGDSRVGTLVFRVRA